MITHVTPAEVAVHVAGLLQSMAAPTHRFRKDVGNIQIDMIKIHDVTTNNHPSAIQFSLETPERMGAELRLRLDEFAKNPHGTVADLIRNLTGIVHEARRRRSGHNVVTSNIRQAMGI
jgi:hypothetical protein